MNYTKADGPTILAGVVAGDSDAITEAKRRINNGSKSSHMKAAALVLGTTTTAPAPVVKLTTPPKSRKGTGVGGAKHTALRAEARKWRIEQYHLGIKVTDRDACLHHGTLPAKELAVVGMTGLAKAIKAYKAQARKAA